MCTVGDGACGAGILEGDAPLPGHEGWRDHTTNDCHDHLQQLPCDGHDVASPATIDMACDAVCASTVVAVGGAIN